MSIQNTEAKDVAPKMAFKTRFVLVFSKLCAYAINTFWLALLVGVLVGIVYMLTLGLQSAGF